MLVKIRAAKAVTACACNKEPVSLKGWMELGNNICLSQHPALCNSELTGHPILTTQTLQICLGKARVMTLLNVVFGYQPCIKETNWICPHSPATKISELYHLSLTLCGNYQILFTGKNRKFPQQMAHSVRRHLIQWLINSSVCFPMFFLILKDGQGCPDFPAKAFPRPSEN